MQEKIAVGWSTVIGVLLGVAGLASGIATGLAGVHVAGLPPAWQAGIGVATLWITKLGRYAQATAQAGRTILPTLDAQPGPVQIPPVGFIPDAVTVAALDGAPTHPGEQVAP